MQNYMDSANHYSKKSLFWMSLFIASVLFFSPEISWSITNVDGVTLNEDTTWTMGESPYVVSGTVEIGDGATLTVEAGVVVKFVPGAAIGIKVLSGGNFLVEGSAAAPVIFTDIRDDSAAGDTNGDEGATSPVAGAWDGIVVDDGGNATLQYAHVRYGADGIFMSGSGSLLMDDCMVTGSEFNGVWLNFTYGINMISRCTLKQNGMEGISIWDTLGYVSVIDCTITENGTNGIWISELPLVRFMDGLTVRFAAPVTIDGCMVSGNFESGIKNENISSSIADSSITGNAMYGIYVIGPSMPEIFSNTVSRNNEGIRCEEGADPLIGGSPENRNNIFKNAVFGVNNLSAGVMVNATHNWWGDYLGPIHPSNPAGKGDAVSDDVDFSDFVQISALAGDLNNDNGVDLTDVILGLQILAKLPPAMFHPMYAIAGIDVNGDGRAGIAEAVHDLRDVAGLNE